MKLTFNHNKIGNIEVSVKQLLIAGWAGRNLEAIEHHIKELEEIGVSRPTTIPCYYQVANTLLTTEDSIQVIETHSSGEVECVILQSEHGLLVAIGSDHTDRKVESYNVAISKQVCAKPLSQEVWLYEEVADHWDKLEMRCYRYENGQKTLYQNGTTSTLLPIPELIKKRFATSLLPNNTAMFCGTQAVLTQIGHGDKFCMELHDPVLNRTLTHEYHVQVLEMVA